MLSIKLLIISLFVRIAKRREQIILGDTLERVTEFTFVDNPYIKHQKKLIL